MEDLNGIANTPFLPGKSMRDAQFHGGSPGNDAATEGTTGRERRLEGEA